MKQLRSSVQRFSPLGKGLVGASILTSVSCVLLTNSMDINPAHAALSKIQQAVPIKGIDWNQLPAARSAQQRVYQIIPALPQFAKRPKPDAFSPAGAAVPKADIVEESARPAIRSSVSATLVRRFQGPAATNLEPPDPNLAVGPNDLIVATNAGFQIYSKSGVAIGGLKDPSAFFAVPSNYDIQSDPKFVYDTQSNRFFGVWIGYSSSSNVGSWFVSISSGNSADGSHLVYQVDLAGQLPDYPGLGVCNDKLVLTANNFANASSFSDAAAVVLNKSQMLAGTPINFQIFRNIKTGIAKAFTVQPATSLSSTTTCHMVSLGNSNSTVQPYRITGVPSPTSFATLSNGPLISITGVSQPPLATQKGSTRKIDTSDTRLLGAVYRNGRLWTSSVTGCNIGGKQLACANLLELTNVDTSPTKGRQKILGFKNQFLTFPALSIDNKNNVTAIYSRLGSQFFPSLRYVSWLHGEAIPQPSIALAAGQASYQGCCTAGNNSDPHRWGDFFGAAIDPSNQSSIWLAGEFKATGLAAQWNTMVGQTKIP